MDNIKIIKQKYKKISPFLDERLRRIWAANEALSFGCGGQTAVQNATGLSRSTIHTGQEELLGLRYHLPVGRVRRAGTGRKTIEVKQPGIVEALDGLVDPTTRGDPESPLRWTTKSARNLAQALCEQGYQISEWKVRDLLKKQGYSLQSNRKTKEGSSHPDRDAQFNHINEKVGEFLADGQPVVSVDAKKKELVGEFKNNGREWYPKGEPEGVLVHDFVDREKGKAIPYGVYDIGENEGWVSVGVDHDTAEFAVETLRNWWWSMGVHQYPDATKLLITADCGGSNGYRLRLWKFCLQRLVNEIGFTISVCHLPPGTSKWNRIEHRLFSQISKNWRGRPLVNHETIVSLIANTKTETGLTVNAALDLNKYPTGIRVSDDELASVNLIKDDFHGEWNYQIDSR